MSNFLILASVVIAMVIISLGLFYADDQPPQPSQKIRKEEEKAMKKAVKASAPKSKAAGIPFVNPSPVPPPSLSTSPFESSSPPPAAAGNSSWVLSNIVVSASKERIPSSSPSTTSSSFVAKSLDQSTHPAERSKALEKLDLVGAIGGRPVEPIDTFIGLGGKRLRHIKLLGNSPGFDWSKYTRFVWFDLGARVWPKGSTQWFARNYPRSSTFDAELYDVLDLKHTYPRTPPFKRFSFHSKAAWIRGGTVTIGGVKMGHVKHDTESLDKNRVTVWKTQSVDFAEVLKQNFSAPTDYVVLKMDVEGGEWPLLRHLEKTGALEHINEMMLECHPPSPEYATSDRKVALRRGEMHPDCIRLINRMRLSGVFSHGWF